jgi:hypothetical protein
MDEAVGTGIAVARQRQECDEGRRRVFGPPAVSRDDSPRVRTQWKIAFTSDHVWLSVRTVRFVVNW